MNFILFVSGHGGLPEIAWFYAFVYFDLRK